MRKKTQMEFLAEVKKVHGDRYDYSRVVYENAQKKVCIICPEHGEFWQLPSNILHGSNCPKCKIQERTSNKSAFIAKCREIYGELYDYSKVDYINSKKKVCVICPKHGEFWVTPNNHMRGSRCPACYGTPKKTVEEFIKQAEQTHGKRYDYSKVNYIDNKHKVCIICPEHGEFWQLPYSHIKGLGCTTCSGCKRLTNDEFIQKARLVHEDKYDYSKVNYVNTATKVCIICPEHGEFWQKPNGHLNGYGCPVCGGSKRLTNEEFIQKARLVHEDKYDYSKVNYVNTATKVCIICPEHGEFWQTPNSHLFGAGCPTCPESNMEGEIRHLLLTNHILFEQEKTFDWLVYHQRMFLDFFLPEYGVAIECQGRQHFAPSDLFGGEEFYKLTIERDAAKKKLCQKHGIRLLYFSNVHIEYPYPVFESMRMLVKAIKDDSYTIDESKWQNKQLKLKFEE